MVIVAVFILKLYIRLLRYYILSLWMLLSRSTTRTCWWALFVKLLSRYNTSTSNKDPNGLWYSRKYLFFFLTWQHPSFCTGHTYWRLFRIMLYSLLLIANEKRTRSSRCSRSLCQIIKKWSDLLFYFYTRTEFIK
jgi:hypothetical protein